MSNELPTLVMASSDVIISRIIGSDDDAMTERWSLSNPIPGAQILGTWQVYQNIWITLAVTDAGHYCIYQSTNLQKYILVHDHASKIHNVYYIDDGHALFSAEDGWWATQDSGSTWAEIAFEDPAPVCMSLAVIPRSEGLWYLVGYGQDHKIYSCEYPGGEWGESYDASGSLEKWYPAIAGSAIAVLAADGKQLIRSLEAGLPDTWQVVQTFEGYIKSIVVSNQSNLPTFLIVIELPDGDKIYWTYDLGDSVVADLSRAGIVASVQSVTPTGYNTQSTLFAVAGQKVEGQAATYKILEDE